MFWKMTTICYTKEWMSLRKNSTLWLVVFDLRKKISVHQRAVDSYMASADVFFKRMLQHLADEEDLIIPLMLEQRQ